jgi:hypothetical protein
MHAGSPFDSIPSHRPSTSTGHGRKHSRAYSRNPNAAPLPAFSFNPGAASESVEKMDTETAISAPDEVPTATAPRRILKPFPLPDFSFNPGAELPPDPSPSPSHPILEEMAANQQRVSRSARPAPLPAFTFGGGSTTTPERSPSPSKVGFGDVSGSLRANRRGHQRQGSEFIGGGAEGNPLISTSPAKGEARSQGPPVTLNPRTHQHRRSQAISISEIDTSELIKANAIAKHRAGSAPSTPSDVPPQFFSHSPQRQSMSYVAPASPTASPRRRGSAPGIRPRVGFSDTIDVIPRPLSLISSETEGSTSTVRGNHSVTGSINSIATSPNPRLSWAADQSFSSPIGSDISPRRRPVTADPSTFGLGRTGAVQDSVVVNLPKRPLSASGSPAITNHDSPPTKKKHFWFNNSVESSPNPTPKVEQQDPFTTLRTFSPSQSIDSTRPKTSPERSASLKKRKVVKSWTHGIFSRKGRPRSMKPKPKRIPTPPLSRRASDQLNDIFDGDNTVVIQNSPSPIQRRGSAPASQILTSQMTMQYSSTPDQVASPIIDLDAALGPFGSEEKLNDSASRAHPGRMAKLHSAGQRTGVDALGYLHRRAESAPAMPPMNRTVFGMHNMGSNVSLSHDVFDEEEEDNFLAGEGAGAMSIISNEGSTLTPDASPQPATPANRASAGVQSPGEGLGLSISPSGTDGIIIVDTEEDLTANRARSSESTIEAPVLSHADVPKRPATSPMPMEFTYTAPRTNYASSTEGRTATNSLISSPDPEHNLFDEVPRFNRCLGEPSPEFGLRASSDDLPSLTDSVSTSNLPRFSSSANTRNSVDQRSVSVSGPSVTKSNNAWKRASLASLNRLIPGSSNGSKLKFETVPDPPEEEKARKKSNRISKLMHFWRSKEKGDK